MTIHCTVEALADLGVFLHAQGSLAFPLGPLSLDYLGQIRHFCLYSTPFIQGWSIVLTVLWLKFNWCVDGTYRHRKCRPSLTADRDRGPRARETGPASAQHPPAGHPGTPTTTPR